MKKKISVIIPVLNEGETIRQTLGQFAGVSPDHRPHEIIIVDGDRRGATLLALQGADVITSLAPPGRALQMNRGAAMASGEILLFLHADTLLPANALRKISEILGDLPAGWGAFDLGIASSRSIFRLVEAAVRIRTRVTRIPYGDQALFVTRELFHRVGGFPRIPIMEDVALARRLRRQEPVMRIVPEKVRTSARRWEREGLVTCTLRNWLLITAYLLGAAPETLVKHYRNG